MSSYRYQRLLLLLGAGIDTFFLRKRNISDSKSFAFSVGYLETEALIIRTIRANSAELVRCNYTEYQFNTSFRTIRAVFQPYLASFLKKRKKRNIYSFFAVFSCTIRTIFLKGKKGVRGKNVLLVLN